MGFVEAIKSGFSKYVTFSGRASRSEYWYWVLFVVIVQIIGNILDALAGTRIRSTDVTTATGETVTVWTSTYNNVGYISGIVGLILLLPSISVAVRRLHDTDRSGWWWWLNLIPCVGWIILIVFYVLPGTPGPNRFGPPPVPAGQYRPAT